MNDVMVDAPAAEPIDASARRKNAVDAPARDRVLPSPRGTSGEGPGEGPHAADDLTRIRDEIERVDRTIVELIAERVALARRVGPVKRAVGMPTLDPPREAAVVRRASALAREAGLAEEDVRYVFWHLVGLCRRVQLEEE
ncbi:MAG TPA: chorismate mutase [Longimicrobium sp.]|nr:chorismate mutase [Longimicrobium sp.]